MKSKLIDKISQKSYIAANRVKINQLLRMKKKMKITILGSGSAYGAPMVFNNWAGIKDTENPKNRRTRASLLLETEGKSFLFDMGPDFRSQMNDNNIQNLDAIFITHGHYDHIAGLGELWRAASLLGKHLSIYCSVPTLEVVKNNFSYMFDPSSESGSKNVSWKTVVPYENFSFKGTKFSSFDALHKDMRSTGFRYGSFAYLTDWEDLDDCAIEALQDLDLLILECNNGVNVLSNGHADIYKCLAHIEKIKPKRTILTHISARVDHLELEAMLPSNIEVGYDGMVIEL